MNIPDELLQHTIVIEPYQGRAGDGSDYYATPAYTSAFVDEKVRTVRTATGDEAVSDATAYVALDTEAPALSRVTLPSGRQCRVLVALRRDAGDLPAPSHLEIVLGSG